MLKSITDENFFNLELGFIKIKLFLFEFSKWKFEYSFLIG